MTRSASVASRPELYFAIVSPVGTPGQAVRDAIRSALAEYGYDCRVVQLSDHLDAALKQTKFESEHEDLRLHHYMDAGDRLCESASREDAVLGPGLVALLDHRLEQSNPEEPLEATAFLFSSLKRPKEIERLRAIYGPWLFVIGAQAPSDFRRQNLLSEIQETRTDPDDAEERTMNLILRDHRETGKPFGQNVLQTFPLSDIFIDVSVDGYEQEIVRLVRLIFEQVDDPNGVPRTDEYAMAMAYLASRRSSSLTRRVGAALVDELGQILATGVNEVAKTGGGHYSADDEDGRDITRKSDYSRVRIRHILNDLLGRLASAHLSRDLASQVEKDIDKAVTDLLAEDEASEDVRGPLADSELRSLVEYHRAVHAEMSAILDCARRGVPTQGTSLYSTTYPCHLCAKEIVAAGISRLIYIDPYPKSLAHAMYSELVAGEARVGERVPFRPYTGISPWRFSDLFRVGRSLTTRSDKNSRRPLSEYSFDFEGIRRREELAISELTVDLEKEDTSGSCTNP